MFETKFVSQGSPPSRELSLTHATILVDQNDFEGIHIAATTLSEDFERVTGQKSSLIVHRTEDFPEGSCGIIVGSLDKSPAIQRLVEVGKLDVTAIKGKWECYITKVIDSPFDGCERALVIAGSDKRGTIFGVYSLSEQIGVSPWYWWADVPPKRSTDVYALDVVTQSGPPSVKYRGIFINDEAPSLSGWVHENCGPVYNVKFYKRVFELLLRLKANFLWPAMWFGFPHPGQSFFIDDPLNQETADKYGIVISTSHHEPMQRAANEWFSHPYNEPDGTWSWIKNEEKVTRFFKEGAERARPFESYVTMGMRGHGDRVIDAKDPRQTLQEVIGVQRKIIEDTYGREDGVSQLIALYKEVQVQYDSGLQIPDDVTLLFADDNFGTIRRLPSGSEKKRRGRAGIYYHMEYVGDPRSYKWHNSNSCAKIWQQLEHAYREGADQVWIFNVGDLKPMEVPLTFALNLAWNINFLEMPQLQTFFDMFVDSTFQLSPHLAKQSSQLLFKYSQLIGLRRHEHIEHDTFSVLNYNEADNVLEQWSKLLANAEKIYKQVLLEMKPSFYQLVLHPLKATHIYISLRVSQAKNRLYAEQRRNSTNTVAHKVLRLFDADFDLSGEYHSMNNGKWNHIMRQPHYGYRTDHCRAPSRDMISGLCFVQTRQRTNPLIGNMGIAVEGHIGVRAGVCCEEGDRTHPSRGDLIPGLTLPPLEPFGSATRWFEIYPRDTETFSWRITSPYDWLKISMRSGDMKPTSPDVRIDVSVDWDSVPRFFDEEVLIDVSTSLGDYEQVHVRVVNRVAPTKFSGFIESDGHISMNAANFACSDPASYDILPFIGRTLVGGVTPRYGTEIGHREFLHYPFFTYGSANPAVVELYFTMTLETDQTAPITYDIGLDEMPLQTVRLIPEPTVPGALPPGWLESVMDGVWKRQHKVDLSITGAHLLKIRLNSYNCVLEKIVVDVGGVRESYLGPPESFYYTPGKKTTSKVICNGITNGTQSF